MQPFRTVVAGALAVALVGALAACGNGVSGDASPEPPVTPPTSTTATTSATTSAPPTSGPTVAPPIPGGTGAATGGAPAATEAVEGTFRAYYAALQAEDWATTCALSAPETIQNLLATMAEGAPAGGTCEEAFSRAYAAPGGAELVDEIVRTTEIQDITVTADQASVTFSAELRGNSRTVTNKLRRIEGQWRLVDISS